MRHLIGRFMCIAHNGGEQVEERCEEGSDGQAVRRPSPVMSRAGAAEHSGEK